MGMSNADELKRENLCLRQTIEELQEDICPCCGHGKNCTLHICDKGECPTNIKLQTENDGLQEDKKALQRVEVILKIWSSVINPNYKKIYADIKQTIALKGS